MDEGAGESSPWANDDWEAAEHAPVEFARRPTPDPEGTSAPLSEPATPHPGTLPGAGRTFAWQEGAPVGPDSAADGSSRRSSQRTFLVGGALALAAVTVVAFAVNGSSPDGDSVGDSEPPRTSEFDTLPESSEPRTTTPRTTVERTTVPNTISLVALDADGEPDDDIRSAFIAIEPLIPELELGTVVDWKEWRVPVAGSLASIAPTEIVFLAGETLNRLELPSGEVRSVTLPQELMFGGQIAAAGGTIVVLTSGGLVVLRDGEPAVRYDVGGQVTSIHGRRATGDFLITIMEDEQTGMSRLAMFDPDGAVTPIEHPRLSYSWPGGFALGPTGELIVTDVGGIYSFDPATEAARRLSDGLIVGWGQNHALVQQCDETLACTSALVALDTWTATAVPFVLDQLRQGYDTPRLSPSGTHLAVTSYTSSSPELLLFDVMSGERLATTGGTSSNMWGVSGDIWASDGSGIFAMDAMGALVFESLDGKRLEFHGFDNISQMVVLPR